MDNIWFVSALWIGLALIASLISIRIAISVALVEIVVGAFGGNLISLPLTNWINYLAGFGAILLTFLAGTEIDPVVVRRNFWSSMTIGLVGFFAPYFGVLAFAHFALAWPWAQAQIAGISLSTTSVAVVYAVMVETGFNRTEIGKVILAACFVNDLGTVLALGLVFANYNVWLALFAVVTIAVLAVLPFVTPRFFRLVGKRVSEPEIKLMFLVLFGLGGLANLAKSEAVLPAYLVGMALAPTFLKNRELQSRIRAIAFAFLTPFYFLKAGSLVEFKTVVSAAGLIAVFLGIKMLTKFVGILPLTRAFRFERREGMYTTLMMCTGLTFGSISALFGLTNHIIDQGQYTILVTAVILSGQLRVALREDSGIKLAQFRERLRKVLPEQVIPWLAKRLEQGGLTAAEAEQQAKLSTFGFEPGDIVTKVMSFGSLTPIAVRVVGTDLAMVRQHATQVASRMKRIPFLRDVQFEQTLDYPSVEVTIDREKAGLSGAKVEDVARALVMATSSTRFTNLNYWVDVKTGFDYLVQIQVPPLLMEKAEDVEILPLESVNPLVNLMVRDVATVRTGVRSGEFDRSTSQRYLTLTANVEGEDMGRASAQVQQAIDAAGTPPRGVRVEPMGQLPPMNAMFQSLGIGLGVAVFVIFVLLTANFQSPRMALVSIGAVPGVLAGIVTILYATNTSLNIESFMGSIMSLGVSVSNSVLLVTFMNEHWKRGASSTEAAIVGAGDRLRPILMTAGAMTVGMVPMALALERGSQMQAPLGLAVIGGLVMSTIATLLVLPSIFAVVIGSRVARSPSIYPDDRDSAHYDPALYANQEESVHGAASRAEQPELAVPHVIGHGAAQEVVGAPDLPSDATSEPLSSA